MESWTHAAANLLSMMPGANAGITMNATAMSAASMRPDANRRDHPAASATSSAGPALRAGITQEIERHLVAGELASMRPGAKRRDHTKRLCDLIRWPGASRRDHPGDQRHGELASMRPGAKRRDHRSGNSNRAPDCGLASMRPGAKRRDHPAASATSSAGPALRAGITQEIERHLVAGELASMRPSAKRRDQPFGEQ